MDNVSISNLNGTIPFEHQIEWANAKQEIGSVYSINFAPSYPPIIDEDAFDAPAVARGMADIAAGRIIPWEQVKNKLGL
jgi:hypothetical protein